MASIKQDTAAKIGLFSAIMMIFGAVVGIGIFFKNKSVFVANGFNWINILLSWVIAIVLVLCMALSFGEIVTCRLKNRSDGLGGWAEQFCGHHFGRFARVMHSLVYYPVMTFSVAFFTGEAALNCFSKTAGTINFGNLTTLYTFLVGGGIFVLLIILNYLASTSAQKFSNITSLMKFLPLAAVFLLGIIFGCLNNNFGLFNSKPLNPNEKIGGINPMGMIMVIPAILFAFEGYLVIGNIAGEVKNPERNVPLSIVLGIIIISLLNMAITIGLMFAGTGNVYELMQLVFGNNHNLVKVFSCILSAFIFICVLGVLNANIYGGMRAFQSNCEAGVLFKGKKLVAKNPSNPIFAGTIYLCIVIAILWIGTLVPSLILNSDAIVDGCSNILVVMFYLVYGSIVLGGFINRFTKKIEVTKISLFPFTAVIAVLACYFVFAFCGFWQFLVQPIMDPMGISSAKTWGLFIKCENTYQLCNWQVALSFWIIAVCFFAIPFINDLLIRNFDKENNQRLIWQ